MITIIAKCNVKPQAVEPFLDLVRKLVPASRGEAGNVSYEFFRDTSSPEKFTFIECWKDRQAIETHNATAHFTDFAEKSAPFFAAPLDVALYQKLL